MDLIREGWPYWVAGITIAIIMSYLVKRAESRLTPEQKETLENKAEELVSPSVSRMVKWATIWIVAVIISTIALIVFLGA